LCSNRGSAKPKRASRALRRDVASRRHARARASTPCAARGPADRGRRFPRRPRPRCASFLAAHVSSSSSRCTRAAHRGALVRPARPPYARRSLRHRTTEAFSPSAPRHRRAPIEGCLLSLCVPCRATPPLSRRPPWTPPPPSTNPAAF
jgi:hypothetical protein